MQFCLYIDKHGIRHVLAGDTEVGTFRRTGYEAPGMEWECLSGRDGTGLQEWTSTADQAFAWVKFRAGDVLDVIKRIEVERERVAALPLDRRLLWNTYSDADGRWQIALRAQFYDHEECERLRIERDAARKAYLNAIESELQQEAA